MNIDEVQKRVQELCVVSAGDEIGGDTEFYRTNLYEDFIEVAANGNHTLEELILMANVIIEGHVC